MSFVESGQNMDELLSIKKQCKNVDEAALLGLTARRYAHYACHRACMTLIAIRKFRADEYPILRLIDKNVVLKIAKLVYQSREILSLWSFDGISDEDFFREFPDARVRYLRSAHVQAELRNPCHLCTPHTSHLCQVFVSSRKCRCCVINICSPASRYHLCRRCELDLVVDFPTRRKKK